MKKFFLIISILAVLTSCKNKNKDQTNQADRFNDLMEFIEKNGDFINSDISPAAIDAEDVYNLKGNTLIIDLRPEESFQEGHIPGSKNVSFNEIINYFENSINPSSFDTIVLVSADGQAAFFAGALLRLLGYDNVYVLRFGLASWNEEFANQTWLANLSSKYSNQLEKTPYEPNKPGKYPTIIEDTSLSPRDILKKRAQELLNKRFRTYLIDIDSVMKNSEKYYIVFYWKEDLYKEGHLKGARFYPQRKSLSRKTLLNTLPLDKPIVIYCNSGNSSAAAAAYLNLIGYNALTLNYGTNSFMYDIMLEGYGHPFTKNNIKNYPIEKSNNKEEKSKIIDIDKPKKASPKGGC